MNKLSKTQKDEFATAFAMLALYDGGVSRKYVLRHEASEEGSSVFFWSTWKCCGSHLACGLLRARVYLLFVARCTIVYLG